MLLDSLPNHKPLGNNLIVRRDVKSLETGGGIILHNGFTEESHTGVIVAAGAGKMTSHGVFIPNDIKVGDHVVLARHAFQRNSMIKIEGDDGEYCKISADDVLAILDEFTNEEN